MQYTDIIKRAWRITWRYRALWWLGLFAGISGWRMGTSTGGSNFSRNFNSGTGTGTSTSGVPSALQFKSVFTQFQHEFLAWVPVIFAVGLVLVAFGVVWWILSIAARAGLVRGVDDVESGRELRLSEAWSAGFGRWGSTFLLGFLLGIPGFVLGLVALLLVAGPIVGPLLAGGTPSLAAVGGICGALLLLLFVGIPLSFVIGILYVVGLRFLVLDGLSATDSIRAAWHAFRTRFKDVALMWLINWGLNWVAAIAVAIPLVIIVLVVGLGGVLSTISLLRNGVVGPLIGVLAFVVVLAMVVSYLYQAIWGTFTSALWTVLFRRMTGREVVAVQPATAPFASMPQPVPPAPMPPAGQPAPMPQPAPPASPETPA